MKAQVLIKMMEDVGWYQTSQKGSHRTFKHSDHDYIITVPDHGKADLGKGLLNALMKKAGLK
jgi:predicted RNA binding protein YcfA (HicA-like mRNA interferase family)